jgi:hypothetical protein
MQSGPKLQLTQRPSKPHISHPDLPLAGQHLISVESLNIRGLELTGGAPPIPQFVVADRGAWALGHVKPGRPPSDSLSVSATL